MVAERIKNAEAKVDATFKKEHTAVSEKTPTHEQLQNLGWQHLVSFSKTMDELYQTEGIEQRAYFNCLWKMDMQSDPKFQAILTKYTQWKNMQ